MKTVSERICTLIPDNGVTRAWAKGILWEQIGINGQLKKKDHFVAGINHFLGFSVALFLF